MFSFLSRPWRQQQQEPASSSSSFSYPAGTSPANTIRGHGDEGDNNSSHSQPYPSYGTEGTSTTTTVKRRSPLSLGSLGGGGSATSSSRDINISPPIPRAVPASLMGLNSPIEDRPSHRLGAGRPSGDEQPNSGSNSNTILLAASSTPLTARIPTKKSDDPASTTSASANPRPGQSNSSAWFEEAAARRQARRKLEAGSHSGAAVGVDGGAGVTGGSSVSGAGGNRPDSRSGFYPPPEVVRLDSDDPLHDFDDINDENTPRQPNYANRDSAGSTNTDEVAHMYASYARHLQELHHQHHNPPSLSSTGTNDPEFYGSPFDSDSSEDVHSQSFPFPPATLPTPPHKRWQAPKLQLQTVSPLAPNPPPAPPSQPASKGPSATSSSSSLTTTGAGINTGSTNPTSNDYYAYAYSTPASSNPNLPNAPNNNLNMGGGNPYYPLAAKQLSPIVEQDYISPTSAKSRSSSSMNGSRFFLGGANSRKGSAGSGVLPSPATTTGGGSVFRLANVGGIKAPGAHLGGLQGGGEWMDGSEGSVVGTVTAGSVVSGSGGSGGSGGTRTARTSGSVGSMKGSSSGGAGSGAGAASGPSVPAMPNIPPPPVPSSASTRAGVPQGSSKEFPTMQGGYSDTSPVGPEGAARPSPAYSSFLNRPLNRTQSQTSSKSDSQSQNAPGSIHRNSLPSRQSTGSSTHTIPQTPHHGPGSTTSPSNSRSNTIELGVQTPTTAGTTTSTSLYTAASTIIQSPTSPAGYPLLPPAVPAPVVPASHVHTHGHGPPVAGSHNHGPVVIRPPPPPPAAHLAPLPGSPYVVLARPQKPPSGTKGRPVSHGHLNRKRVDKMPPIEGSVDGHYYEGYEVEEEEEEMDDHEHDHEDEGEYGTDEEEEDEVYEMESMRDSFVTAGTGPGVVQPGVGGVPVLALSTSKTKLSASDLKADDANEGENKPGALDGGDLDLDGRGDSSGGGNSAGPNLSNQASQTGDSFITRRWERSAALFSSPMVSPTKLRTKKHHRVWPVAGSGRLASLTPAFWTFWIGFLFPVLWLIGGWHFTNCGEQPPKYTFWEWYFWNQRWSWGGLKYRVKKTFGCLGSGDEELEARLSGGRALEEGFGFGHRRQHSGGGGQGDVPLGPVGAGMPHRRKRAVRPSPSQGSIRTGKVYPALPRWVAERQATDDGRARLNDMKRSLKGISFGYPFIPRMQGSVASYERPGSFTPSSPARRFNKTVWGVLCMPNRVLDQLYGVKLSEVRGRPESGRRMIDPWIQRCRYGFCYGLVLLAIGLCVGCAYLIARNTRQL